MLPLVGFAIDSVCSAGLRGKVKYGLVGMLKNDRSCFCV